MALPYDVLRAIRNPITDAETLKIYKAPNADAQEKENFINALPLVAELRANPDFKESRPHLKLPPAWRDQNLTAGTLMGPGRVTVPPYSWGEKGGKSFVQIFHVGSDLCGHLGIIHGGFLATVLDEALARTCFPVLPHNVGMTAKLDVTYKAPAMANKYYALKARTVKSEGRKAWVEGHIETIPTEEGEQPVIVASASALFISPRQASVRALLHAVVFSSGSNNFALNSDDANVCDATDNGEAVSSLRLGGPRQDSRRERTVLRVTCRRQLSVLVMMVLAVVGAFSVAYGVAVSGDYLTDQGGWYV